MIFTNKVAGFWNYQYMGESDIIIIKAENFFNDKTAIPRFDK